MDPMTATLPEEESAALVEPDIADVHDMSDDEVLQALRDLRDARAQLALYTDTINAVREAAKAVTGGNCDFADDDVERLRALAMEAEGLRAERDALREAGAKMTCAARGIPDYEHSFGQVFYNEPPKCIDCGMPKPEFDAARQALAGKGGES